MYDIQFSATSSAGWAEAIGLVNADTNQPMDIGSSVVELEVNSRFGDRALFATTANGTIERPAADIIQWRFSPSDLRNLRRNATYDVGCRLIADGGTTQLFVGSLSLIDGEVR